VALGSALTGAIIDIAGTGPAFVVAGSAAALAAALATLRAGTLRAEAPAAAVARA
jgi:hypothetical protein